MFFRMTLAVALLTAMTVRITPATLVGPASAVTFSKEAFTEEVTKRDLRGRVKVMNAHTLNGNCTAEIVYGDGPPRIYAVAISRMVMRNVGYLQINDGTEENLTDATLMGLFDQVIRQYCLPHIGYIKA